MDISESTATGAPLRYSGKQILIWASRKIQHEENHKLFLPPELQPRHEEVETWVLLLFSPGSPREVHVDNTPHTQDHPGTVGIRSQLSPSFSFLLVPET